MYGREDGSIIAEACGTVVLATKGNRAALDGQPVAAVSTLSFDCPDIENVIDHVYFMGLETKVRTFIQDYGLCSGGSLR